MATQLWDVLKSIIVALVKLLAQHRSVSVLSVSEGMFRAGDSMMLPRRHQSSQTKLYSFHNSFCSSHHSAVVIWTIF